MYGEPASQRRGNEMHSSHNLKNLPSYLPPKLMDCYFKNGSGPYSPFEHKEFKGENFQNSKKKYSESKTTCFICFIVFFVGEYISSHYRENLKLKG